jgi:hypothetical protein
MPMTGPVGQGETPTTDTPVTTDLTGSKVTTGGGRGPKTTPVKTDPNAWAENITDPMAWADENLGKEPDGPLDLFKLGQTVARTRALAIIAESEGNTDLAESLRSKARQVVEDNKALQFVPEGGMNGTSIASALLKDRNIVDNIFKTKTPDPVVDRAKRLPPQTVEQFGKSTTREARDIKPSKNISDKRKGSGMGKSTVKSKRDGPRGTRTYTSGAKPVRSETGASTSSAAKASAKKSLEKY